MLFCGAFADCVVDRQQGRGAHKQALKPGLFRAAPARYRRNREQRETTLSWLKVVRTSAFRSLTLTTSIPQLNSSVPSLRDCGSAAIAATDARKRILPGRQAEVPFSQFRRLRIRGSHDAIKPLFPVGWCRPVSQPISVAGSIPRFAAIFRCDRPSRLRTAARRPGMEPAGGCGS